MTPVKIHGTEQPIRKIFSDEYFFQVPYYQRPYSWTTDEAGELLDDLLAFLGDEDTSIGELDPYFLGSIVLVKSDGQPDADVIDGQQRLTTLTILLSVLRRFLPHGYRQSITKRLKEEGDELARTPDRFRLALGRKESGDAEFLQRYIQEEDGLDELKELESARLNDAQMNIRANALYYFDRFQDFKESTLKKIAEYIDNQCYLVVVSSPDQDSAYRIFSVLNDRGLDLSYTDILKAEVIGTIEGSKQAEYASKWEALEDELGRELFEALFAHIRTIFRKVKPRETLLKEFREYVQPQENPSYFVDEVLSPYADALITLIYRRFKGTRHSQEINRVLGWLNRVDNADWLPPAMAFLNSHQDDPELLMTFFRQLERLASGMMVYRANINERIERYAKVLEWIEQGNNLSREDSPLHLTDEEIRAILDNLNGDLYRIRKIRLFVLLRLDAALSEGEASYDYEITSVEHVLPQEPDEDSVWMQWFPTEELRQQYVHRLGNLVLLSRRKNRQAQNYDFNDKKERYFKTKEGVSPFALTSQVLSESEWTPEVVEKRQKKMLSVLKEVWDLYPSRNHTGERSFTDESAAS